MFCIYKSSILKSCISKSPTTNAEKTPPPSKIKTVRIKISPQYFMNATLFISWCQSSWRNENANKERKVNGKWIKAIDTELDWLISGNSETYKIVIKLNIAIVIETFVFLFLYKKYTDGESMVMNGTNLG